MQQPHPTRMRVAYEITVKLTLNPHTRNQRMRHPNSHTRLSATRLDEFLQGDAAESQSANASASPASETPKSEPKGETSKPEPKRDVPSLFRKLFS
jgi:hypothetical protein